MSPALEKAVLSRWGVFAGAILVHVLLVWLGHNGVGEPMGDIHDTYAFWVKQMQQRHVLLGLTAHWVYPYPDLLFMFVPHWIAPNSYETAWLVMETALDLLGLAVLIGFDKEVAKPRIAAAWFFIGAQLLMGPVAISRLDAISIAIVAAGVGAWLSARPSLTAVWFATATWIKVWPFALAGTALIAARQKGKVLLWGVGTALAFLAVGAAFSKSGHLLGFITDQTTRNVQVEAPVATYWLWAHIFGVQTAGIYFSRAMLTFEVAGEGIDTAARVLGPLMAGSLVVTFGLGWLAQRRADLGDSLQRNQVFAWTALTAALDLIVFNKVGSPQYYGWLIAPAILAVGASLPGWKGALIALLAIFAATGVLFPTYYTQVLLSHPDATAILTVRNLLAVGLLGYSTYRLATLLRVPAP